MDALTLTEDRAAFERNIAKSFVFSFLMGFPLWLPIWVLYLHQELGFSLTQITLLDVPFFLFVVFSEVPTGAVADRFGRRVSLMLSAAMFAVAVSIFGLATNYIVILISNIAFGLAVTFRSGADTAILYDSMKQIGRTEDFQRVNSRLFALNSAALVGGLALGAPTAAATSFRLTFMLGAITNTLAFLVAFTMHEPKHAREHTHETYLRTLASGLRDAWRKPTLRYIIAYSGIISAGAFGPIIIFQQPWLVDHGISLANVGWWQAPARGAGVLSALATGWLLSRMGERGAFAALPVVLIVCNLALAGIDHAWIAVAFLGMGFVNGLQDPILASYINHRIDSAHRATVLSVQSVISSIILAVIEPIAGVIADAYGLRAVFLMFAAVTLVLGGAMLLLWDRAERDDIARGLVHGAEPEPAPVL